MSPINARFDLDALDAAMDDPMNFYGSVWVGADIRTLIQRLRKAESNNESFRMAMTTCRQERAMAEAMVGRLERSELIDGKTLADQAAEIRRLASLELLTDALVAELEAQLSDWRQPSMLTEVEYRERTAKLTQHIAKLERVREAADRVATYLTIEAEFSGDEAEHSGLHELDAALGALIALEEKP